ncbi:MAG: serine hydrolase, partial [Bacteroidota bacterium]|nr:serine hydrolase [Bacteroidota bacterium]
AEDLFKICQMLLNKGELEGVRYLKASTIDVFNKRYFANIGIRRALGFDKPLLEGNSSHCSKFASSDSYGHSGFTGTYIWIEPQNQTIFIFLSNRVYPYTTPNKLAKMNIRTDINDLIYQL